MSVEIQAVVLAAGRGNKLYPYTQDTPKALLPVANRPLLYYPLLQLQNEGFTECLVVVASDFKEEIAMKMKQTAAESGLQVGLTYVGVSEGEAEQGSMAALRRARPHLTAPTLLLLSCDLVCDLPLHRLANLHRINAAAVTVLLAPSGPPGPPADSSQEEERKKWLTKDEDVFGVEGNRLLLLHRAAMGDEQQVSRSLLIRHPHIQLRFGLSDAHMYLLDRAVLEFALDSIQLGSFYDEVLPWLVQRQFRKPKDPELLAPKPPLSTTFVSQASTVHPLADMNLDQIALQTTSYGVTAPGGLLDEKEGFRCFAHIAAPCTLCVRVRTPNVYSEINRLIARSYPSLLMARLEEGPVGRHKPQVSHDSLVGSGVQVAEKSSVKKSVVGNNCVLNDKSKVVGSVVMDCVDIGERATVQNCVLGHHVTIGEGASLKDCYLGPNVVISKGGEYKGETLSSDDFLL